MRLLVSSIIIAVIGYPGRTARATDLQFEWSPGMTCKVIHSVDTMQRDRKTVAFSMKTSTASEDVILIEITDLKLPTAVSVGPAGLGLNTLLPLLLPDFLVDSSGAVTGLKDLEKSRAAWGKLLATDPSLKGDSSQTQRVLEVMGSQTMVENTVHLLWNPMVSAWAGSSWEPDEHYTATVEEIFPIGNLPYKSVVDAHFVGMRPCGENAKTADCVLLRTEQKPDPEGFKEVIKQVVSKFGGSAEDLASAKMDLRMYSEVLTHPATLVPVRVRAEKHLSMTGTDKGKPVDFSGKEVREWQFDCDRS